MSEIDHRAILAGLSAEQHRELTALSDGPGLVQLAAHLGLIGVTGVLIASGVPEWPLLLPIHGIAVMFLFTALHETIHGTAFKSPWLNNAVSVMAGFAVMVPPAWFRYFHFAHHRHTHDPAFDPELMSPKPRTRWEYVRYLSGIPMWVSAIRAMIASAMGKHDPYIPAKGRAPVEMEARLFLAAYGIAIAISILFRWDAIIWLWLVPVLLGQPFLRAYLLAEHARCPHVASMLENTRTTFTTRFVRFIAWNMPYHAEHHTYPVVPFHKLPALHEIARAHLKETEAGYGRFHRHFAQALQK